MALSPPLRRLLKAMFFKPEIPADASWQYRFFYNVTAPAALWALVGWIGMLGAGVYLLILS